MTSTSAKDLYTLYKNFFNSEEANKKLEELLEQPENAFNRKNFTGHITASGIVLCEDSVLLVFHSKLQKFLQPGGHVETVDTEIWKTAAREIVEETGITAVLHPWHNDHGFIPIHIDSHHIPYSEKRQEDAHIHHDFIFVFTCENKKVLLEQEAVSEFKWVEINHEFTDRALITTISKTQSLLK